MRVIYGAGKVARHLLVQYMLNEMVVDGIAVTDSSSNPNDLLGVPVRDLSYYKKVEEDVEISIGVSRRYANEVIENLSANGFDHIIRERFVPICPSNYAKLSQEDFLYYWYFYATGKELDWHNLRTYNEKMQWLKIHDLSDDKKTLSDKYEVRKFIADTVGEKYLVPMLGVWDRYEDIPFEDLPNEFVLKCNHGSGYNIIVRDKKTIDHELNRNRMEKWLSTDYSDVWGMELQYKGIKPRIIAEKLLRIGDGVDIPDYKFFVFDGTVKMIQVDIDRNVRHRRNLYTPDWQYIPVSIQFPTAPDVSVPKPDKLDEMIAISEKLGKGYIHVRVDLYYVDDKIYFGEMTFTHGSGQETFEPESYAYEMGSWMNIERK